MQANKLGTSTALTGQLPVGAVGHAECFSQSYQQLIGLSQGQGMPYGSSAVPGLPGHDHPGASGSVAHTNAAPLSLSAALSGTLPSNGLSSRRASLLSDTSSIGTGGVWGSMSRRSSQAGGDALGIGAFNAMREAGLLPLPSGRRGSLAGGDALGIGAFNAMREAGVFGSTSSAGGASRRGSLAGGDALGIGLFNAMREAGALGGGAGASNGARLRPLVSLKSEGDNLVLPQSGKHSQARRASICSFASADSEEPSSLLLQLGAAAWARENSVKAETVEEKNATDGAAPLSPSEIEKVVGRLEVDQKVSGIAPVAT